MDERTKHIQVEMLGLWIYGLHMKLSSSYRDTLESKDSKFNKSKMNTQNESLQKQKYELCCSETRRSS